LPAKQTLISIVDEHGFRPALGVLIMSRPTFTCCHPGRPVPSRACGVRSVEERPF